MIAADHTEAVGHFLRLVRVEPGRPTVEFLGTLMRAFLRLPYENLTKIIRAREEADPLKRLRLPATIVGEHIERGAGGTCFSLTYLFRQVLARCGYACRPVMCDRSYGPDTHCALIASVDGADYLVDPGYLLEHPLVLPRRGVSSFTGSVGAVHLMRLGATSQYLLSTQSGGRSAVRYRLKDRPMTEDDFVRRWIDSFGWAQMRHACVTLLRRDGHVYLRDDHLRHATGGAKSHEKLKTGHSRIIEATFGIHRCVAERARGYVYRR